MTGRQKSIKRDILLGAIVLLALLGLGLFAYIRAYSLDAADTAFDRVLAAAALSIADNVRVEDGHLTVELPIASLEILGASRETRAFYAVRAPDHSLITGYPDLPDATPAQDRKPRFFDATYSNDAVRIGSVQRYIDFGEKSGWISVTVAETREARTQLASVILRNSLTPMAVAGLIMCFLISTGLNRAWAPLVALENELVHRAPTNLNPIQTSVPKEVNSLVSSLNLFMQRFEGALSSLRRISVDTTHEMRTPLASIRALTEVAASESDPGVLRGYLQRIHANAVVATRIVNQLLAEAAVAHHIETTANPNCDLLELYLQAVERLPTSRMQRCRLAHLSAADDLLVRGSPLVFRELIDNLLDNALNYAPEGFIDVGLRIADGTMIELDVADRGPGIPDSEKGRVLERFRRGAASENVAGTGLGLNIVRNAANAAGGHLALLDRPGGGLIARVILPRATS
ncbi:sensor histidine kinase N-terminal domain-containing protein [Bradyrhizobium manausense]|uniref:sensor histidine kinase n=1 Tax=Bradyrhizobium manausense TaxID=989370 RepID=UPI001BABC912|nr:sensor histidine kinase [Bradyrhizobium manausense]MBR0690174.1 sensor histidine kinase N-terminal domain-containing protein [Bradyrhizobium manausense]MBR0722702.1 sensor histidine kinase N-terminal domain-containing protein [Bradyrhizobium manausense]